jgi:hypothetical protein
MKRVPIIGSTLRQRGFALVVTLSLMILLTILAVGLLALSSISLRNATGQMAADKARANARMALMLALGELQKQTGPDTRVTARADILNEDNPPVLGVWKSWEGTNHETSGASAGLPISPGSDYRQVKNAHFLSWLLSGTSASAISPSVVPDVSPGAGKITLVGTGSVGTGRDELQIHLPPSAVTTGKGKGSYAWWIGGENQKARLPKPHAPTNDTVAAWSARNQAHSIADPKVFRMESLLTDATPANKAVTLQQSDLIAPALGELPASSEFFHDLSTTSAGLLTNTATGGWRKDLSLVTENWDMLPASGLPFFRLDANTTTSVAKPTPANHRASKSILYPWSDYFNLDPAPIYQPGAVSSWHNLKDHATAYKSGGVRPYDEYNILNSNEAFNYIHKLRTTMVIARVHWLFSHRTILDNSDPDNPIYKLQFLITPVITMWNPYNTPLTSPANLRISIGRPLPCAFRHYDKDGNPHAEYRRLTVSGDWSDVPGNYPVMPPATSHLSYLIPASFTLAPGETRVFSPESEIPIRSDNLNISPGLRLGTGHYVDISYIGPLEADSKVMVDVVFDTRFKEWGGGPEVVGAWIDMFLGTAGFEYYLQVNRLQYPRVTANKYWPPIPAANLASPRASEINGIWQPFLSAVYGSRISGPSSTGLPGKGLLQTNPMVSYFRMEEGYADRKGGSTKGVAHPANAASDFSFFAHTANDDKRPNSNGGNNRGFIVSGFTSADGLSRLILSGRPTEPLASLAELQNWDMRSQSGVPPFQLNVIANSDASPLIPPNNVVNAAVTNPAGNLQHDDSYCANHLLFDDWFFSSIAPKSSTLEKTYTDFVTRIDPLTNRAYQPIAEDTAAAQTPDGPKKLFDTHVNRADSWQTIASRLEVEGMFNVNSTSPTAWRALLRHARNQKIPHHAEGGTDLSPTTDHALSRFNIAGDVKAGEQGMSGGFSKSSELTGYRVFDEPLLDSLADEIVKQVRLRGPFLSLAEFVNRQLGSDKNLALAGAIQAALNEMSNNAAANDPYQVLKSPALSKDAGDPNDPKLADAGYAFPEAAIGKSTYGLPGWTRQADVLRRIAPILSARDDTFTIRAYGDARDAAGNITARATCEAVVRRTRDYVDPSDAADIKTLPVSTANQTFGRRYEIISFRWLNDSEI